MLEGQILLIVILTIIALLGAIALALSSSNRSLEARLLEVTWHLTKINQEKIEQNAELINLRWQMKFYQNPPRGEDGRFIPYKEIEA